MFGIDSAELLIIAIVALVVIGPRDLPKVMRTIGHWVSRARDMAKHFRAGVDTMMREAELEEMQKKWAADNERIMREHPTPPVPTPGEAADLPAPVAAYPAAAEPGERAPAPPAPPRRPAPAPPVRAAPPAPPRELP